MIRQQRFYIPLTLGNSSNNPSVFADSPLIVKYLEDKRIYPHELEYSEIIHGLFQYGKIFKSDNEAQQLAKILIQALKTKNQETIGKCLINLYTKQSFLYKKINKFMRNSQFKNVDKKQIISFDYEQVVHLLPFCVKLNQFVKRKGKEQCFQGIVYRGANLTKQQINQYARNKGKIRQWNAFTSTTKNKQKASKFGNTLFVIKLGQHEQSWGGHYGLDIQTISCFPNQEEVLLFAGKQILIESVKSKGKRYLIQITVTDI